MAEADFVDKMIELLEVGEKYTASSDEVTNLLIKVFLCVMCDWENKSFQPSKARKGKTRTVSLAWLNIMLWRIQH